MPVGYRQRTWVLAELDGAVEAQRTAVDATPGDDPIRAAQLSDLAITLLTRFDRTKSPEDLTSARR